MIKIDDGQNSESGGNRIVIPKTQLLVLGIILLGYPLISTVMNFLNPSDMPEAVREFCRRTGQAAPETPGELIRCILESLALKCRMVLDEVRQLYRHPINRIHVIGGGARNELLCQLTASAAGLPVAAGPFEATAIGNLLVQALALGYVGSPAEVREIVRLSFPTEEYQPGEEREWGAAYERFRELHEQTLGQRREAGLEHRSG